MTKTEIEDNIGDILGDLQVMQGALMAAEEASECGVPQSGLFGQVRAMEVIITDQLETLDRIINSLSEIVPKQKVEVVP